MEIDKIYLGDCIMGMTNLPDNSADLVCSDPPYLIGYKTSRRIGEHKFKHEIANDSGDDAKQLVSDYIHQCYRVLKVDTAAYFFCSSKTLDFFREECESAGFVVKNIIIWDKGVWTAGDLECQYGQMYEPIVYCNKGKRPINGKRIPDIWHFNRVSSDKLVHQNQKPVSVMEQCILKSSDMGGGSRRWLHRKWHNSHCSHKVKATLYRLGDRQRVLRHSHSTHTIGTAKSNHVLISD